MQVWRAPALPEGHRVGDFGRYVVAERHSACWARDMLGLTLVKIFTIGAGLAAIL